jgi:hypothetical protein
MRFPARHSALIADEISHLPIGSGGCKPFLHIVNAGYERCAMAMTSNHSLGDSMVATALRDRLST